MGVRASDRRLLTTRTAGAYLCRHFSLSLLPSAPASRAAAMSGQSAGVNTPGAMDGRSKLRQLPLDLSHRCLIVDVGKSSAQVIQVGVRKSRPCKIAGQSPTLSAHLHCGQSPTRSRDKARIDIVSCYPNRERLNAISRPLDPVALFARRSTARVTSGQMRVWVMPRNARGTSVCVCRSRSNFAAIEESASQYARQRCAPRL